MPLSSRLLAIKGSSQSVYSRGLASGITFVIVPGSGKMNLWCTVALEILLFSGKKGVA